ncbi:MAG TPA: RsmD family RNA methyltransferase [Acidimicrobiales bacterium]|nr:RsmD family RNA methyltransferase [Acidimicrobiales bacterium]
MRVVAGLAGGRRLQAPAGRRLRPTSERVREAVFSSLHSLGAVQGARVLDLFAGTGALGIEALSRGAAAVTFVEADPAAAAAIRANLETTGLEGGTVVQADVGRFLDDPGPPVDLAFADPPYAFAAWPSVLERLPADLAVLESRRPVEVGEGWVVLRTARYGDTHVTTVRKIPRRDDPTTEGGRPPV